VTTVPSVNGQSFLTNGLVGYYPFSGNANDASGNGNNAVVHGSLLATNRLGVSGESYSFASGAYIETTNSVGFPISTNDFAVSVWVSVAIFPSPQTDVAMLFVNRQINQFQLALNGTTGNNGFLDFVTGGGVACHSSTNSWTLNRWYNLMVARANNTISIYRDGILIGQSQSTSGNSAVGASRNLDFGLRSTDGHGPLFGQLDDIRIYNRALSPAELQQLYEYESGPRVNLMKAVKPSFANLSLGTNYQLQVSSDLVTWTNQGSPFTATSTSMIYPQYWDVDNWGQLFFRLQISP